MCGLPADFFAKPNPSQLKGDNMTTTSRIPTLVLLWAAATATYSYGQVSPPTPAPAANSKVTDSAHRMVIANGAHITVAYFPTKDTPDQAIAELQAKAKAESDEANKRVVPELLPIEPGIALASIRTPAPEEAPAAIAQRVIVILKSGMRVTGVQIRLSDIHVVVRTDDNVDFEIARSEIAAIAKRR